MDASRLPVDISLFPSFEDLPDPPVEEIVEPKSIRNRLISTFLIVVSVPLFILGFLLQQQFHSVTLTSDKTQVILSQKIASEIDDQVEESFRLLRQIPIPLSQTFDSRQAKQMAQGMFNQQSNLEAAIFFSPRQGEILRLGSSTSIHTLRKNVNYFIGEAVPRAKNGTLTARFSKDKNNLFFYGPINAETLKKPIYVAGSIKVASIYNVIKKTISEKDFLFVVFDDRHQEAIRYGKNDKGFSGKLSTEELQHINNDHVGEIYRDKGKRNVSFVKSFVKLKQADWISMLAQPVSIRDKILLSSLETTFFVLFVSVIITALIAFYSAVPLARSVSYLKDSVDRFAKTRTIDDPLPKLEKEGISEFIELGNSFDKMARRVKESQQRLQSINIELEGKVVARTATISKRNEELQILKELLVPIDEEFGQNLDTLIQTSAEKFRVLLGMDEIRFVPFEFPRALNYEDLSRIKGVCVRLNEVVYGHLRISGTLNYEKIESLQRFAGSLAIVLSNSNLVSQIAKERATLNAVFKSITDGIVIIGKSGRIRYSNDLACDMLNAGGTLDALDFQTLINRDWTIVSGEMTEDIQSHPLAMRLRSKTESQERKVIDLMPFHVSNLPEFPGQRVGFIIRDITKEAQVEIMKDNLIAVVAHELKTPLTAVHLSAESIKSALNKNIVPQAKTAEELIEEVDHLNTLLDDLLDVSRIEAGRLVLMPTVVQVASLIDRASRLTRSRYAIEITREIDSDAETFYADPYRITQIFVNLFNNAARYKRKGDKQAHCFVKVVPDGDFVKIIVTDDGVGISQEKLAHVFDRFYQCDMSIRREVGGLGLGLSIVKGIVEAHNGHISVSSQVEKGSCFTIWLPT